MFHRTLTLVVALSLSACWEIGGANQQQSVVGNGDTGNVIGFQLSISDDGRYLVAAGADQRLYAVEMYTLRAVPLRVAAAERMVFADADSAYFTSHPEAGGTTVERASLRTGERLGRWHVPVGSRFIAFDAPTQRLAFWSWFERDIRVLDPHTGQLHELRSDEDGVLDVRWLRSGELAVVRGTTWRGDDPTTVIQLYGASWRERRIEVPNCASKLVISPVEDLALLAPTSCTKDPVSVIDLARAEFVENLPGFGPVAFSPDGMTAVAFGRQAELATFGITTATPFSLLFIDMADRSNSEVAGAERAWSIDTLELGDAQPIYQLTPDGEVVLIYSVLEAASYDGIYLIDIATRTIRETQGPEVALREFVITPDSDLVYLIDNGLYRLDVRSGSISYVALTCGGEGLPTRCNPELVNLLPRGDTLVLGWRQDPELALFDIPSERVTHSFVVGASGTNDGDL